MEHQETTTQVSEESLKLLVKELKDQKTRLANVDLAEEVNSYCNNLIIDVTLTIQKEVEKLNNLEAELIGQIEEYRKDRLKEHQSKSFKSQVAEDKKKVEVLSAVENELLTVIANNAGSKDEVAKRVGDLTFEMSLLESKMKRGALNKRILSVKENISPPANQIVELVENSPLDSKKSNYSRDLLQIDLGMSE